MPDNANGFSFEWSCSVLSECYPDVAIGDHWDLLTFPPQPRSIVPCRDSCDAQEEHGVGSGTHALTMLSLHGCKRFA